MAKVSKYRGFALVAEGLLALSLLAGMQPAVAQSASKAGAKKAPATEKPGAGATKPAAKSAAKLAAPATPEEAAKVLDLRTIPLLDGGMVSSHRTLGMLMYEVKGTPQGAFDFHKQQLVKLGFQELPGGYSDKSNSSGNFTKDGFHVRASTYEVTGDPKKAGWSNVTLVNDGNVPLEKLPVPPGVKPFHPQSYRAAWTTAAKPAEAAAACRKLLIAAGWEPYGKGGADMQYFKQNAIKLQVWISTPPGAEGKTLIQYDTELWQVDLPAPEGTEDPRYTDFQKTLRFDSPQDQTDAILAFYQERLPKLGWKATTEKPIVDDRDKSRFVVYRNARKEMLSLDLTQFTGIVRVELSHQTAAEVAEADRLAKAQAELAKQKLAKQNMKVNVAVPLPAKAENLEQDEENLFEFTLATGSGPATLETFRKHFRKQGWTEEKGAEFDENTGNLEFKKDEASLRLSYFDTGVTEAEIRVSASKNVILEPAISKDKPAGDEPAEEAPKPAKKPKKPSLPGLPELPPGVELPDEVKELLKKALEEPGDKESPAAKTPSPKKPAPAE
jgi:hypothetical protein